MMRVRHRKILKKMILGPAGAGVCIQDRLFPDFSNPPD
jgi:hypothetical protein